MIKLCCCFRSQRRRLWWSSIMEGESWLGTKLIVCNIDHGILCTGNRIARCLMMFFHLYSYYNKLYGLYGLCYVNKLNSLYDRSTLCPTLSVTSSCVL